VGEGAYVDLGTDLAVDSKRLYMYNRDNQSAKGYNKANAARKVCLNTALATEQIRDGFTLTNT